MDQINVQSKPERSKIFGSDRITINERFTFKMSEIQGIISESKTPSNSTIRHNYLFILISGNKILVDSERLNSDVEIFGGWERQLEAYHSKWEEYLSNVGEEPKIKKITI